MRIRNKIYKLLSFLITGFALTIFWSLSSCGGKSTLTAASLNIKYQVINLSPDVDSIDLYINFKKVNTNPFVSFSNQGYFYLTSTITPFQFRPPALTGTTIFTRDDLLARNLRYTLFITGSLSNNSLNNFLTVDTASAPAAGKGKLRFVNASPVENTGLDLYANGTKIFSAITYKGVSKYIPLPAGNYDLYVTLPDSTTKLYDIPLTTVQDGTLYTLYTSGYPSLVGDVGAFTATVITNR